MRSRFMSRHVALAAVAWSSAALFLGCGPGGVDIEVRAVGPWFEPARQHEGEQRADWAVGEVVEVSPEGDRITVKMLKGKVRPGGTLGIYRRVAEGEFSIADLREITLGWAEVFRVEGHLCYAEVAGENRISRVQVGDAAALSGP